MKYSFTVIALSVVTACVSTSVWGTPVQVTHQDTSDCDPLFVPSAVDELGVISFPPDELILATDIPSLILACPTAPNGGVASVEVSITNLTSRSFSDLWYVADPETTITNVDGLVNGEEAFKIDSIGLNQSLVLESINPNGIFEPGEQWDFVIDGYVNASALPASAFHSVGLVGGLSAGDSQSSGSIIAMPVPEPTAIVILLSAGCTVLVRQRGSKKKQ